MIRQQVCHRRAKGNPVGKLLIVKVINKGGMPGEDKTVYL
jgi:hypothetical protein